MNRTSKNSCGTAGSGRLLGGGTLAIGGLVAGAGGLWLGWPSIAAAGLAPIVLALAPCLVMCGVMGAIGACCRRSPATTTASGIPEAQEPGRQAVPSTAVPTAERASA